MTLNYLIDRLKARRVLGETLGVFIDDITDDSREVGPGVLFVAVRGSARDGHCYIETALSRKAAAVVLDDTSFIPEAPGPAPIVVVDDARTVLPKIADIFFGSPQGRVRLIGITGTNGKTTVSYLVRSIIRAAGAGCGVIGTIGYQITEENIPFANTTPGTITMHRILKKMADAGLSWVATEVSSHALDQGRVAGLVFSAALFTNLTQDHLDYHKTMEAYFKAKRRLFSDYSDERTAVIINADDSYGQELVRSGPTGKMLTYGFSQSAHVRGVDEKLQRDSSMMTVDTPRGSFDVTTPLVGRHNLANILAAVAFGVSQGFDLSVIKRGAEALTHVPGRLERLDSPRGFSVFVDYAHTDDALKNVLESLRQIPHNGRIIAVFGCGGDRDRGKRPKMGRVVTDLSDYCIITSDNPRSEDPQAIAGDIVTGVVGRNFEIELDRRAAIRRALAMAGSGDFVLVAGKGHENTQILSDRALPFSDKKVVVELMKEEGHV